MFEETLLINDGIKRSRHFLTSLVVELLIVSFAMIAPWMSHDHVPAFHWKDVAIGPAPSPPAVAPRATHRSNSSSTPSLSNRHRVFHWIPSAVLHAAGSSPVFAPDAPPTLGRGPAAGNTGSLGTFLPNPVASVPFLPESAAEPAAKPSAPISVGGDVQMAKLIRKVTPEYPPIARAARISGVVHLIGTIGKDGAIRNLQLVSGHPILARAAMQAVAQWLYQPTLLNGKPVEVIAPIEVSFTLGQ